MTVETLKSQDFSVLLSNAFGMDKVEDTRKVFEFVINPKSLKREVMDDLRDELASRDFVRAEISDLRTELKQDIADLRTELKQDIADLRTELKKDMANVRAEMTDLRTEMANLRTELKGDISDIRAELDNKIELKVSQSTRTLVVTIISSIIAMSAIIVGGFLALYLKA